MGLPLLGNKVAAPKVPKGACLAAHTIRDTKSSSTWNPGHAGMHRLIGAGAGVLVAAAFGAA